MWRSGRDSKAHVNATATTTERDALIGSGEVHDKAGYGVDRDRDEPLQADAVGAALAAAMLAWCKDKDRSAMRRVLLELLLAFDEKK